LLTATLRVSAIIEVATGCALLTVPSDIIQALIGSSSDQAGWIVGRVLGGALLALGVAAMFPPGQSPERGVALGFAIYNASTFVILGVAGWPARPMVGSSGRSLESIGFSRWR
jgi:hypothetical protein